MNFPSILIIAVGLGLDAFSVAIGVGAVSRNVLLGSAIRLSFSFGMFQTLMPISGWFAGMTVADVIAAYDHWVAFGLLAYVGGKMIMESFRQEIRAYKTDPTRGWTLIMLSVATSIDALAVGLSFAFLKIPILYPSIIIGLVAFAMTMIGIIFGEKLGKIMGKRIEAVGGLILVGIGFKILIEHLT
jgi:manganese efflux pump family protein